MVVVLLSTDRRSEIMTATPSTEQTRGPEHEVLATAASTEQAPVAGAGGCDCGCACCAPANAGTVPAKANAEQTGNDQAARAGCGCG